MVRVETYLNTTQERVASREYNIWFGISLGNKYFSKENIEQFIPWLLANTREHLLIVVADEIHAINLEVLNEYSKDRAMQVALRRGEEKIQEIKEIILKLSVESQKKITLVRWDEIAKLKPVVYGEVISESYRTDGKFRDFVLSIVKENPKVNRITLSPEQYDRLAEYILLELPIYLNGITYGGRTYLLQPYPGLGRIDRLIIGLQDGALFPEIAEKIGITEKIAILETYVE